MEANTTDPASLIPILSEAFQTFDRSSEQVKACTILRPVLEFLWAVSKSKITPIILSPGMTQESKQWRTTLHLSYISQATSLQTFQLADGPTPMANNEVVESLAGALQ